VAVGVPKIQPHVERFSDVLLETRVIFASVLAEGRAIVSDPRGAAIKCGFKLH